MFEHGSFGRHAPVGLRRLRLGGAVTPSPRAPSAAAPDDVHPRPPRPPPAAGDVAGDQGRPTPRSPSSSSPSRTGCRARPCCSRRRGTRRRPADPALRGAAARPTRPTPPSSPSTTSSASSASWGWWPSIVGPRPPHPVVRARRQRPRRALLRHGAGSTASSRPTSCPTRSGRGCPRRRRPTRSACRTPRSGCWPSSTTWTVHRPRRAFLELDRPGDTALRRHVADSAAYYQWVAAAGSPVPADRAGLRLARRPLAGRRGRPRSSAGATPASAT